MIEWLILVFIAGICFGYGLRNGIRNVVRSIRYHIWAFWNYKIMRRPEPDPVETMMELMPLAMMAGIMGSLIGIMQKEFGEEMAKEKLQTITKKKS